MRDLGRAKRAHRRGEGARTWRLYESRNGKVPKDLVTMFAGTPTPQIARSPRPFLTDRERGTLSEVLCNDAVVFLAAFAKKTQKLRRVDVARAAECFRTMKDECE